MTDDDDYRVLEAGLAHARSIFAAPAIARHSVVETSPGPDLQSTDELREFFRKSCASFTYLVFFTMFLWFFAIVSP